MGEKNYELIFFFSLNNLDFFTRKVKPKLGSMPQGVNLDILQEAKKVLIHSPMSKMTPLLCMKLPSLQWHLYPMSCN